MAEDDPLERAMKSIKRWSNKGVSDAVKEFNELKQQRTELAQKIGSSKDAAEKKTLQDEADKLQATIEKWMRDNPQSTEETRDTERTSKKYVPGEKEAIEAFKKSGQASARAKTTVSKVLELPSSKPKSVDEQLKELQLKQLKKQQRSDTTPVFQLPDIPKDTATSIVIASLVATFFILAGIGTKFSQLWGYAFNAPIASIGNNQQNQDISTAASNLQTLENTTGGASGDEAWGIPDIYHMIYDTGDAGITLDEERTA